MVEAADTAPFFHNNVMITLEEAVSLYSGPQFNAVAFAKFNFDQTQNQNIARFLRGVNTLQNINVAEREGGLFPSAVTLLTTARTRITQAQQSNDPSQRRARVQQAITKLGEAGDAVADIP